MSLRLHYFKILKRSHSLSLKEKFTVRKEMKCVGNSEILHEIVCDTTHISSCFSNFCVVSRNPWKPLKEAITGSGNVNDPRWTLLRTCRIELQRNPWKASWYDGGELSGLKKGRFPRGDITIGWISKPIETNGANGEFWLKTEQQSDLSYARFFQEQWSGVSSWPKKEIITLTFLRFYMNVTLTPNLVLFVFFRWDRGHKYSLPLSTLPPPTRLPLMF